MTTPRKTPGGRRAHQPGRPPGTSKPADAARTRQIRIHASAEEWQSILDNLTPEERTQVLMVAVEKKGGA